MSDTVKWILELQDKVSPAGKRVLKSLQGVQKLTANISSKGLKLATAGFAGLGKSVAEAIPKMVKWAAIGALAAGAGLAYAGTKLAIDAQQFKDRSGIALKALLKSEQAAAGAYKRMLDFANFFGEDPSDALERFNSLLAGGFSARDAEKLMQAFGDLKLVTPSINADALGAAFGKIRSKAKLDLGEFQSAVEAGGLNITLAYEKIGKKIGKNAKEVEALLGSGRVDADVGLIGLIDAINERTNSKKAGDQLNAFANTTTGLVTRLKNLPQQFVFRMTADDSPLKGTLTKILDQLDPDGPNGKKIIGSLNKAFEKVGEILGQWATPEGIEKLIGTITKIIEVTPKVIDLFGKFCNIVLPLLDVIIDFKSNCKFLWAELKRGEPVMIAIAAALALPLVPILAIPVAIAGLGIAVLKAFEWMWDLGKKALKWGQNISQNLIAGITGGLVEGTPGVKDAATKAAEAAAKGASAALKVRSPSRVFHNIGLQTMAGFEGGIVTGAPEANAALIDAIGAGTNAASAGITNIGGASTSTRTTNSRGPINIHVGGITMGSPEDSLSRDEIMRLVSRGVTSAFERASLE